MIWACLPTEGNIRPTDSPGPRHLPQIRQLCPASSSKSQGICIEIIEAMDQSMNAGNRAFELRPAIGADRDSIAEIWHSSASLPGVGPPVMPTARELRERVDLEFAAGWTVTVAANGSDIAGFAAIKPREAILDQLFVRPDRIGGGVGTALLAHSKLAMPEGFTLFTASSNMKARRFYEEAGLAFIRDDAHPRTGHPVTYYCWRGT